MASLVFLRYIAYIGFELMICLSLSNARITHECHQTCWTLVQCLRADMARFDLLVLSQSRES